MSEINQIVELDVSFVLNNTSPEDIIESLGISNATTEELLGLIKNGGELAKIMLQSFEHKAMEAYHGIGKRYAPIAFAIYGRLLRRHEEPRLPTFLAVNRHQSSGCGPNTILFWDDPDAIRGLYESLEKDGYYGEKCQAQYS